MICLKRDHFFLLIVFLVFVLEIELEIGFHIIIHYFLNNFYSRTATITYYV